MKNIIATAALMLLSVQGHAQTDSRFYDTENEYKMNVAANDPGTGGGIEGVDDPPAPIDDYIPLLLIAGLGMVVWYARRKRVV